jgi:hypothetical protein
MLIVLTLSTIMLNVNRLNVIRLSVIRQSVIRLNFLSPSIQYNLLLGRICFLKRFDL